MDIKSVVDPNSKSRVIESMSIDVLKELYDDVDIKRFIEGLDSFQIVECEKTGYRYFHPPQLEGDGKFYYELATKGEETEYYPEWRWAHTEANKLIDDKDKVLEIGSGGLSFITKIASRGVDITGLEISPYGVAKAKEVGVKVIGETIQEHSKENKDSYDAVCFFEVLEHVYEIQSFLQSAIGVVKKGGKIIFSVPNNSSYLKGELAKLNYPPHHVGLWDEKSIKNLEKVFGIRFKNYEFEPLPLSQTNWFLHAKEKPLLKMKPLGSIYYRLGFRKLTLNFVKLFRNRLKGQTILAVFEKV